MDLVREINEALIDASFLLMNEFKSELKKQGHVNTGKLLNSIDFKIQNILDNTVSTFFFEEYGFIVDNGVSADRIPYSGRTGFGGRSKYIEGLMKYFRSKGFNNKKAKSLAFATANVHKREGMPTRGSYKYSSTGQRTGFVQIAFDNVEVKINDTILRSLENKIQNIVEIYISKLNVA